MIIVADAGPLLHLHWVGAAEWSLPPMPVNVVDTVWREVASFAPDALVDPRLRRISPPAPVHDSVAPLRLDDGEASALSYALSLGSESDILLLCDDVRARRACRTLSLAVVGSIGLIVEAWRSGRAPISLAVAALENLPITGKLHVSEELIRQAIESIGHDLPPR